MKEGYFADVGRCLRGPMAWTSWVVMAYGLIATVLIVYLAIGLYDADSTRDQILYATGLILSALMLAICKVWFFARMNRCWLEERLAEIARR